MKVTSQDFETKESVPERTSILRAFRIRFLVAIIFFAIFIYCDRMNISYGNENADTVYEKIKGNVEIPVLEELVRVGELWK